MQRCRELSNRTSISAEQDEAADAELERAGDLFALAIESKRLVPANSREQQLRELIHAGVYLPRTLGPLAPVARGTFPAEPVRWR